MNNFPVRSVLRRVWLLAIACVLRLAGLPTTNTNNRDMNIRYAFVMIFAVMLSPIVAALNATEGFIVAFPKWLKMCDKHARTAFKMKK